MHPYNIKIKLISATNRLLQDQSYPPLCCLSDSYKRVPIGCNSQFNQSQAVLLNSVNTPGRNKHQPGILSQPREATLHQNSTDNFADINERIVDLCLIQSLLLSTIGMVKHRNVTGMPSKTRACFTFSVQPRIFS